MASVGGNGFALFENMLGEDQSLESQMEDVLSIFQNLRSEYSSAASQDFDVINKIEKFLDPAQSSFYYKKLIDQLDEAEEMLKIFDQTSDHSAAEAAKWCEEFMNGNLCNRVKDFFKSILKKEKAEDVSKCFEEQVKKDPKKAIDTMKTEITGARCSFVENRIKMDSIICIAMIFISVKSMCNDVTVIKAIKEEMKVIESELDTIDDELKQIGTDINTVVMELIENMPVSVPLHMIAWRLSQIHQEISNCIRQLMDHQKNVTEKRNDNTYGFLKDVFVGGLKTAEAVATSNFVSGPMKVLSIAIPALYFGVGVAQAGVALNCQSVLNELEKKLHKGKRLQKKIDQKIVSLKNLKEKIHHETSNQRQRNRPMLTSY